MSETSSNLTSGKRLARSAIWNFLGLTTPLLIGLVAIPLLIEGMGKERFGLLAIIWMGVGYFSLFDMGLGRALTKLVSERLGKDSQNELGPLIWTSLYLISALGAFGAAIVLLGAVPLIREILNVDATLQTEAIYAFSVLALGIPIVVLSAALIGLLEAHQRFATISAIRIPLGILTFGAPLITLQITPNLVLATAALLTIRLFAFLAYFLVARSLRAELRKPQKPDKAFIKPLFRFGGWLTVTNIVGPLMVYFDRFLVGAIMTMTSVTYYVTPYEVVSRIKMLPQSIMSVIFPAMTTSFYGNRKRLTHIYTQSTRILVFLMLPISATFFLFAPEALDIWLGQDFKEISTPVVRWLAVGVLINTLARMPFTLLQSAGKPDLVAKTHLIELLPYCFLLWILTSKFGIAGTAAAWFTRVLADTIALNEIARRRIPDVRQAIYGTYGSIAGILVGFAIALLIESVVMRFFFLLLVCCISAIGGLPVIFKIFKPATLNLNAP